ncbi:TraM recognition domain-containing protein [Caballeronia glebae]|uniref:TraM recognition domain-containing protein n=1 Tax=Caballeronia glebae TaxID=1777143 RepID=UPI00190E8028
MTKGRKKGLRVVSGYQTYTQLVDVYGENLAEPMLGNHRAMVALGVGRMGEKTAERMSRALGQHEDHAPAFGTQSPGVRRSRDERPERGNQAGIGRARVGADALAEPGRIPRVPR